MRGIMIGLWLLLAAGPGLAGEAAQLGPRGGARAVLLFAAGAEVRLERCGYSPGYGEVREACCAVACLRARLPASMAFAVLFA